MTWGFSFSPPVLAIGAEGIWNGGFGAYNSSIYHD